jgi:hypothetical protein
MRRLIVLIACFAALVVPAQALAGGVSADADGASEYVRTVPTVPPPSAATLPFTGEDVILVVLSGLLLAGCGFTLYRQVRSR